MATPETSPGDLRCRQAIVQSARSRVVDLLTESRPGPDELTGPLQAYQQAIRATQTTPAAEWERLRMALAEVVAKPRTDEQPSLTDADAERQRQEAAYLCFFDALVPLEQSVAAELDGLQERDAFQQAPQRLRDALRNYRKGIEIIHRMLKRLQDRKKPMDIPPADVADAPSLPDVPADLNEWPTVLTVLCNTLHDWRAARGDAACNAQTAADAAKRETLAAVRSMIGALDGIESGQRSEPELLARLAEFRADHGMLIDSSFGAYARIEEALRPFFDATGLEPVVIEPGTRFTPDTMEVGGTTANPNRENDEVASMLRRGFRFAGELLRPALVEVVVNPSASQG